MTDFSDPQNAHLRLSNAERDEAVAQLNASLREGRLDQQEFLARSTAANSAVTRGDLAPLFADLGSSTGASPAAELPAAASGSVPPAPPASGATSLGAIQPGSVPPAPPAPGATPGFAAAGSVPPGFAASGGMPPTGIPQPPNTGATPPYSAISEPQPRKGPIGGTAGVVAVSISPLIALILFFVTGAFGSWSYSWLWFLLVPLTYLVVYGAGTRERPDRHR